MTATTDTPPVARLNEHCSSGPYDPAAKPLTHAWCSGTGCACPCHPRRRMRSRLSSHVLSHHVLIDVQRVLGMADLLLNAGLTPADAERAVVLALDVGWTPPEPT